MRTLRTVIELRAALTEHRRAGDTIGLVPTMGAFHEGHLSLMRRARGENDVVVVSLFVNPSQFNEQTDLDHYPRNEAADAELARELGIDYLFAPEADEVYPDGFATTVHVSGVTERLEGDYRGPGHFDGVTTVVTKLFNMVGPDVAYFGQKDAQQALVIKQLVRDLNLTVRIEICPTVRESDGLALSSRNAHLNAEERARALSINRALRLAREAVDAGERHATAIRARALAELTAAGVEPEYFELVRTDTMAPVQRVEGDVLAVVAARVGGTRLIDNEPIHNGRPE
ncbi:MAG TPA: pantoate--beta-alanine ligase [Solirubrobacteraceae bacterium]|nr:pantoate--beta-alanine ligase [Solirubrobacteraceae bacterium]